MQYYQQARSYAYKLDPILYRDLVHDTYVSFQNRGRDLFSEPLPLIFRAIKYTFWDYLKHKYGTGDVRYVLEPYQEQITEITPFEELVAVELEEKIEDGLQTITPRDKPQILKQIVHLKCRGFLNTEIAEHLGVSKHLIGYYLKQLMSFINNPFNGSKTKITKKLSEKAWEKRKDHDEFELEVDSEYSKLFVHSESKEGWLVTVTNPKGAEFYIKNLVDSE